MIDLSEVTSDLTDQAAAQIETSGFSLKELSYRIENDEHEAQAVAAINCIRSHRERIDSVFGKLVKSAHQAHKNTLKAKREFDAPYKDAEEKLRRALTYYREKVERERQRQVELFNNKVHDALLTDIDEQVEQLLERGEEDKALELLERDIPKPDTYVPTTCIKPKTKGLSTREDWDFEIIGESSIKRDYMKPDDKAIRAAVRKHKDKAVDIVGGIRVFKKTGIVVRR